MGIFSAIFSKCKDRNKLVNDVSKKEAKNIYSNEEIEKLATKGFSDKWNILLRTNPNLFPLMFEWIKVGEFQQILHYKSFRTKNCNYAPYVTNFSPTNDFFYEGRAPLYFKTFPWGYVDIKYPCERGKITLKTYLGNPSKEKQLKDNSDILEIDYSPDTIKACELHLKKELIKYQEEKEREKKEKIRNKLLAKKQKQDLEKKVLQELINEGELFPDANRRPPIYKEVADAVWNRDGGKCVYCGSTENLHFDHIIPFSKGGDTSIENLQLLCRKCNLEKSNKIG